VQISIFGIGNQMPVLPQNALRLRPSGSVQGSENPREKIPSNGLLGTKDGLGRNGFGRMVVRVSHR
jgi:hypothetical protein